jgi:GR25 family glycosyltransferase involved in LPS biosynthesis
VACVLSHLSAILRAYNEGRVIALILEDDAVLAEDFLTKWQDYVNLAPDDWTALQFSL